MTSGYGQGRESSERTNGRCTRVRGLQPGWKIRAEPRGRPRDANVERAGNGHDEHIQACHDADDAGHRNDVDLGRALRGLYQLLQRLRELEKKRNAVNAGE